MRVPYPPSVSWESFKEFFFFSPFTSPYYPAASNDFFAIGIFDREIKALLLSTSLNISTAWAKATPTFFNFLEVS